MFAMHPPQFLGNLGWTLLSSVWQFALLWFVFKLILAACGKTTSRFAHSFAASLLLFGTGWSVQTFLAYQSGRIVPPAFYLHLVSGYWQYFQSLALPFVAILYLITLLLLLTRFMLAVRYTNGMRHTGLIKLPARFRIYLVDVASLMGISRKVTGWISEHVDTPQIIGFFKPVILLPLAMMTQLSEKQIEAILLHEMAHIKRNDYLLNIVIACIRMLFFFNPFVRIFCKTLKQEREYRCDEWVLQFRYDPHSYASALFALEKGRKNLPSIGIAASGGGSSFLLQRVHRILSIQNSASRFETKKFWSMIGSTGLLALFAFLLMLHQPMLRLITDKAQQVLAPVRLVAASYVPISTTNSPLHQRVKQKPAKSKMPVAIQNEANALTSTPSLPSEESSELASLASTGPSNDNDFSLQYNQYEMKPDDASVGAFPYFPANSFAYHETRDSANEQASAGKTSTTVRIGHLKEALRINAQVLNKLQTTVKFSLSQADLINMKLNIEKTVDRQEKLKDELTTIAVAKALKDQQLQYQRAQRELQREQQRFEEKVRKLAEEQKQLGIAKKKVVEI